MSANTLLGNVVAQVTVTGARTFQVVRISLSDAEESNIEINERNLLFGADANEGSLNSIYSADNAEIKKILEMIGDSVLWNDTADNYPNTASGSFNRLDLRLYRNGTDLFLTYHDLAAVEHKLESMPRSKLVFEIVSGILKIASDLSGKNYSLGSLV